MNRRTQNSLWITALFVSLVGLGISLYYSSTGGLVVSGVLSAFMIRTVNANISDRSAQVVRHSRLRLVGYASFVIAILWAVVAPLFIPVSQYDGMELVLGIAFLFIICGAIALFGSDTFNLLDIWHSWRAKKRRK